MIIDKVLRALFTGIGGLGRIFVQDTHKDKPDPRDLKYEKIYSNEDIPQRCSFIKLVGPIENQGLFPSCVGQSAEVVKRIHENPNHGLREDGYPQSYGNFSAYIFYMLLCKTHDGIPDVPGTYPRVAMKMLHQYGIPEQRYGPYPATLLSHFEPLEGWEENALKYRIGAYARCMTIEEMVNAIATKGPLLCGNQIFKSFEDSIGLISMPKPGEKSLGGHAYARVGYDLERQAFHIVNSWGDNWGHSGTAWEPFEYARKFTQDCWVAVDREDTEAIAGLHA